MIKTAKTDRRTPASTPTAGGPRRTPCGGRGAGSRRDATRLGLASAALGVLFGVATTAAVAAAPASGPAPSPSSATRPAGDPAAASPDARPLAVPPDLLAVGPAGAGVDTVWTVRVVSRPASPLIAGGVQTRVFARRPDGSFVAFGAGPQGIAGVQGRAVAVAPLGPELAVLMDDGEWLLQSDAGSALARAFPVSDGRLLTFAADADGLYALARVPGGGARLRGPATAPATAPFAQLAPAATAPASAPTGGGGGGTPASAPATVPAGAESSAVTVLLAYRAGRWEAVADLPAGVARPIDPVSLTVQDRTPFVLVREATDSVRVWRLDGRDWTAVGRAAIPPTTRWAQFVHGGPRPTVLVTPAAAAEPDRVFVFDPGRPARPQSPATAPALTTAPAATAPVATAPVATAPATMASATTPPATTVPADPAATLTTAVAPGADPRPPAVELKFDATVGVAPEARAAAYAFSGPFLLLTLNGDKLQARAFDRQTLAPLGATVESGVGDPGIPWAAVALYAVLATAMVYAVAASVRRRSRPGAAGADTRVAAEGRVAPDLPLAPLGLRLLAGLIDASPLVAAQLYEAAQATGAAAAGAASSSSAVASGVFIEPWELVVVGVYLLHTTLIETMTGRTLGKMACGLRVKSVDGSDPTRGQLLTRNLLRVLDVGLQFVPAVLVRMFPALLVAFSPLRQRAGDAAAGTVVVAPDLPREEAADEGEGE